MKKPLLKSRTNRSIGALVAVAGVRFAITKIPALAPFGDYLTAEVALAIEAGLAVLAVKYRQLAGETTVDQQDRITPRPG